MINSQAEVAILAILAESRDHLRGGRLLKTELIKFVYLLDVLVARRSEGKTFTGAEWRFLHFGPYSVELDIALEHLSQAGRLSADNRERVDQDGEYLLYSLHEGSQQLGLESLPIGRNVATDLRALMSRWHGDLNGLLSFVYSETEPMINARPGAHLMFNECFATPYTAVKPVKMPALSPELVLRARNRLAEARDKKVASVAASEWRAGPADDVYWDGLRRLNAEETADEGAPAGRVRFEW